MQAAGQRQLESLHRKLDAMDRLRETLSYKATLARGYAVVHGVDGVVTSKAAAEQADGLEIEFHDGRFTPAGGAPRRRKTAPKPPLPEQGDLF